MLLPNYPPRLELMTITVNGQSYMREGSRWFRKVQDGEELPEQYEYFRPGMESWALSYRVTEKTVVGEDTSPGFIYRVPCNGPLPQEPAAPTAVVKEQPAPFFMVKGSGPTNFIHTTPFDAIREAERLARENPGSKFHVLQSIRTIECGTLTHQPHAPSPLQDNDVPF